MCVRVSVCVCARACVRQCPFVSTLTLKCRKKIIKSSQVQGKKVLDFDKNVETRLFKINKFDK